MKLLWLTRTFPYPSLAGDTIYSRYLIEGCARLGVRVHVICQPSIVGPDDVAPDLPGLTWQIIDAPLVGPVRALFSSLPNIATRFGARERCRATVSAAQEGWDGIIFDSLGSLATFDDIVRLFADAFRRPFLVHISHNHEATTLQMIARETPEIADKLVRYLNARKAARLERASIDACDLLVTNTDEDWLLYEREHPAIRHVVIRPGYDGPRIPSRPLAGVPRTAIVLGSFQWIAKRLNLEALLAAAAHEFPAAGIRLRVVGYMDDAYRDRLSRRFPWADIVGPVDDVGGELKAARLGVIPEQAGGGFKHKTLNYVFGRVPIVGIEGAMVGSSLNPGKDFLAAHDMSALVKTIVSNIDNTARLQALADAAYAQCEHAFDWSDRSRDLVSALEATMRSMPGHAK